MARVLSHGGSCCGMRHLAGFNAQDNEETIRTALASAWVPRGVLVEAVLTNAQCNQNHLRHIPEALQRIGFKLVSRFKNPNSGNICNVFHYNVHASRPFKRLPFRLLEN